MKDGSSRDADENDANHPDRAQLGLSIDDTRREGGQFSRKKGEPLGPVVAVPSEEPYLPTSFVNLKAIAVELALVEPRLTLRRAVTLDRFAGRNEDRGTQHGPNVLRLPCRGERATQEKGEGRRLGQEEDQTGAPTAPQPAPAWLAYGRLRSCCSQMVLGSNALAGATRPTTTVSAI